MTAPAARGKTESHVAQSAASASESPATQGARISPKARRLAKELGVDIASVRGSGPDGEILARMCRLLGSRSVEHCVAGEVIQPRSPYHSGPPDGRTHHAKLDNCPSLLFTRDVDASALNSYREKVVTEIEREHKIRVTHTDLLVALVARVLLKHPVSIQAGRRKAFAFTTM